jgi:hypothetical protein
MQFTTDRRSALASIGAGLMVSGLAATAPARADTPLAPECWRQLITDVGKAKLPSRGWV